jgi:hypothetical protein
MLFATGMMTAPEGVLSHLKCSRKAARHITCSIMPLALGAGLLLFNKSICVSTLILMLSVSLLAVRVKQGKSY